MADEFDPSIVFGSSGAFPGQRSEVDANEKRAMDENELRTIFQMFDTDGSGCIDADELQDAMRLLGVKCSGSSARKVLLAIDTDQNGTVEWEEFYEFFSKVRNPEEVKQLLASTNQRFLDYKLMVEGDPNFGRRFVVPPTVRQTRKFDGHCDNVEDVEWITDTQFVSCSLDMDLKLWDISRSENKPITSITGEAGMYCLKTLGDGQRVLTGMSSKERNLSLWVLETGECPISYSGHSSPIYSCDVGPDQRFGLSGAKNGVVCFHDLGREVPLCVMEHHEGVCYSCAFNEDCTTICTASSDGSIQILDLKALRTAKPMMTIEDAAATGTIYKVLWRGEFEVISCGEDYCAKRWDIRNLSEGPLTNYFGHTSVVRSIALSQDRKYLATATDDGCIRVWVVDEAGLIAEEQDRVDQEIELADVRREDVEKKIRDGFNEVSPQEARQLIAELKQLYDDADYLADVIYERESMGCVQASVELEGHSLPVCAVSWRDQPDGTARVISASQDQTLRLFNFDKPSLTHFTRWSDFAVGEGSKSQ